MSTLLSISNIYLLVIVKVAEYLIICASAFFIIKYAVKSALKK
ncbi:MAG: hypothetical protein N2448_01925 [Caloramator sp.]|nr:hypothetical protein [Caloramator sp.]